MFNLNQDWKHLRLQWYSRIKWQRIKIGLVVLFLWCIKDPEDFCQIPSPPFCLLITLEMEVLLSLKDKEDWKPSESHNNDTFRRFLVLLNESNFWLLPLPLLIKMHELIHNTISKISKRSNKGRPKLGPYFLIYSIPPNKTPWFKKAEWKKFL